MFKKRLLTAVLGIALAGAFGAAHAALATVSANIVKDTPTELDVTWTGSLLTDTFGLPTLTNWNVLTLDVATDSFTFFSQTFDLFGAQVTARHKIGPHSDEPAFGPIFNSGVVAGSFGQTSSYSAMADHNGTTWQSPANWTTPHWDHYSFSVSSAANGNATLELKALHPVPEPESYAMLLAGLGVIAAIIRRRSRR